MEKDIPQSSYNSCLTSSGNTIWAGAMNLAWTELKTKIIKTKTIEIMANDNSALSMIKNFNKSQFSKEDLNPQCYYIKAGYGNNTVNQINDQMKKKFAQKTTSPIKADLPNDGIISYAYFLKVLSFPTPFDKSNTKMLFKKVGQVQSFKAKTNEQRSQVLIHKYSSQNNFMIQLVISNKEQELFLIKTNKQHNVDSIIDYVKNNKNKQVKSMKKDDIFEMPYVKLDIQRHYKQLINKFLLNKGFEQYQISEMFEIIKLKIDQKGAKVQNQAKIRLTKCKKIKTEQQNKIMILDSSFWIVMNQVCSYPYLVANIINPSK